ncbi:MAG: hypothetical protein WCA08_06250 [Desulfoferrobacter sp.]
MREASRIFFPTPKYVDVFKACRIRTFPNPATYRYHRSRILQHLLLDYLDFPHPKSRIYFGKQQKKKILNDFQLPVLVMQTQNAPDTLFVARQAHELTGLADLQHSIIIREHIEWSERIQLVCVQFECVGMLRTAVAGNGSTLLEPMPLDSSAFTEPACLTNQLLRAAQLDDILIEWGYANGKWLMIGMSRPPVKWPTCHGTSNRYRHICEMIHAGIL